MNSFAGKYDEALSNIKKHLSKNTEMYEKNFRNSHETRVSEFFYRRSLTRQIIPQEVIEGSFADYSVLMDVLGSIDGDSSDLEQAYYITNNSLELASKNKEEMQSSLARIIRMKESLENECSLENVTKVVNRYDPMTSYPIPTIVHDDMGKPQYNFSFRMNFHYAYNDGGGDSSYSVSTPVGQGSEVGGAVGVIGAAVACGFMGGCDATTFSFISAGITAVFEAFMSFKDQQDFEKFQKSVDEEYAKANARIKQVHIDLHEENLDLVQGLCDKVDLEVARKNLDASIGLVSNLLNEVTSSESSLQNRSKAILNTLEKDEQTLKAMLVTKRAKFLQMVENNLSSLREEYAKVGVRLITFYKNELLPVSKKVKSSTGLNKLHHQKSLMELIAKGDMTFGDYKIWNAYKRSLK
ncbi:hypothetical protein M900_0857 [Bacteriovorax sp. Seq25_V]|nr:hypothetical protein M900_0857 [Bacteriovorax sp. Seq25_V]